MPKMTAGPKKTKKVEERVPATTHAEYFPLYAIRLSAFPWITLSGKTPEEAAIRAANFVSEQGRKTGKDYTILFDNEPFDIE
jgi:hypothetical protein